MSPPSLPRHGTRTSATIALSALVLTPFVLPSTAWADPAGSAGNPRPALAPALHEWTGGIGQFTLLPESRVVATDARLIDDARTFAADLRAITGRSLPIVTRDAHVGDIVLAIGTGPDHDEGYQLEITDTVRLTGRTDVGVSRGTQTIEQLLAADDRRAAIPRGTARDWPAVGERGFMLDAGRKYYQPSYIEQQIRTAAWYKLNTVHLHLTEWNAFRLASSKFPGLAPTQAYSKSDIDRFEAVAAKYHITIVPEIDLPAHASAIANVWPGTKWSCASMNGTPWGYQDGFTLDVTKPETRRIVKELLDEFIPWFKGPEFHVGTDEYPYQDRQEQCPELVSYARDHGFATTADVMVDFINWMDTQVRGYHKRTVIWNWWDVNQSPVTQPSHDIKVEAWTGDAKPYLDKGYDVVASPSNRLYVTPQGAPGGALVPDNTWLYGQWQPTDHPRLDGYLISRWSDGAETASDGYHDWFAHRAQQVLADRTWGGPRAGTNLDYENSADRIGPPPGVTAGHAAVTADAVRISGTPYGTSPAWGGADNTYDKVYDGNPATFFDYAQADGGYAGIDAGRPTTVTKIRFLPRSQNGNHLSRMVGGRFQGCADGPAAGCVDLATIDWRPPGYDWIQLPVDNRQAYRWLRYLAPDGSFANIAEVEFWTAPVRDARVTIDAPATLVPLATTTVRATVTNTGARPIYGLDVSLTAVPVAGGKPLEVPRGDGNSEWALAPGASRTVSWNVTPALDATTGDYRLSALAAWRPDGSPTSGQERAFTHVIARVPAVLEAVFDPPALVLHGTEGHTTMRLTNRAARPVLFQWSARVPDGLTASPSSGSSTVPSGDRLDVPLAVTADATAGVRRIDVDVTGSADGAGVSLPATSLNVSVPYDDLSAAFDNVGTTSDSDIAPPGLNGGIDGDGSSYSAQALAALGARPGGTVSHGGLDFTWPSSTPGTPDNVLANGQVIKVDKAGGRLGFLTVGTYGTHVGGTGLVTYTDGSTQSFELYDSDWQGTAPADADVALEMPYHNWIGAGRVTRPTFVFFHAVTLDPGKTVATVTLPQVGSKATGGTPALHVWSIAVQ